MNKALRIAKGALVLVAIGQAASGLIRAIPQNKQKHEEIWMEANRQIVAINDARDEIIGEMRSGEYPLKGIDALRNDFDFRTIIKREGL